MLKFAAVLAVCALGVVAAIALLSAPSSSPAAVTSSSTRTLESMFQDDRYLVDSPTATVTRTLEALRALGVGRLRITVLWESVAPDARSRTPRRASTRRIPPPTTHFAPSAVDFGRFVAAAGRRYSGDYVPPGRSSPLARVDFWSVWNEPNQPGWLAPQRGPAGAPASARAVPVSARRLAA